MDRRSRNDENQELIPVLRKKKASPGYGDLFTNFRSCCCSSPSGGVMLVTHSSMYRSLLLPNILLRMPIYSIIRYSSTSQPSPKRLALCSGCVPSAAWPHIHSSVTAAAWHTHTPTFKSITRATNQRACKWTDDPGYTINIGYLNTYRSRVLQSARRLRLINVWLNTRFGGSRRRWRSFVEVSYHFTCPPACH